MSEGPLSLAGGLLSLVGALLYLMAAVGLLRLPDFYTRCHAPSKAATLGLLLVAFGSILTHGGADVAFWLETILLVFFVLLTVPISTQLLVRGAAARGIPHAPNTRGEPTDRPIELVEDAEG